MRTDKLEPVVTRGGNKIGEKAIVRLLDDLETVMCRHIPNLEVAEAMQNLLILEDQDRGQGADFYIVEDEDARFDARKNWVRPAREVLTRGVPKPTWADCCRAAGHLANLVCLIYHPKDEQARKTWPTATWAEIIAIELGIEIPETE